MNDESAAAVSKKQKKKIIATTNSTSGFIMQNPALQAKLNLNQTSSKMINSGVNLQSEAGAT